MKKGKKSAEFPDENVLGPIRARLSDSNYNGGNIALRGKTEAFTLDRLLGYASKFRPNLKIKILAA